MADFEGQSQAWRSEKSRLDAFDRNIAAEEKRLTNQKEIFAQLSHNMKDFNAANQRMIIDAIQSVIRGLEVARATSAERLSQIQAYEQAEFPRAHKLAESDLKGALTIIAENPLRPWQDVLNLLDHGRDYALVINGVNEARVFKYPVNADPAYPDIPTRENIISELRSTREQAVRAELQLDQLDTPGGLRVAYDELTQPGGPFTLSLPSEDIAKMKGEVQAKAKDIVARRLSEILDGDRNTVDVFATARTELGANTRMLTYEQQQALETSISDRLNADIKAAVEEAKKRLENINRADPQRNYNIFGQGTTDILDSVAQQRFGMSVEARDRFRNEFNNARAENLLYDRVREEAQDLGYGLGGGRRTLEQAAQRLSEVSGPRTYIERAMNRGLRNLDVWVYLSELGGSQSRLSFASDRVWLLIKRIATLGLAGRGQKFFDLKGFRDRREKEAIEAEGKIKNFAEQGRGLAFEYLAARYGLTVSEVKKILGVDAAVSGAFSIARVGATA